MNNYKEIVANIRNQLRQYITDNTLEALVIGMSGGIDSAVCAALARPVCDELNIPLIGRSIPILTNSKDEIARAAHAGELFCTEFKETDLGLAFNQLVPEINPLLEKDDIDTKGKIRRGNIKARLRMILLYDLAAQHKGIVLSTDNLTEFYLGFWTLHGDHADYGMIQNLWKTEVYALAEELAWQLDNDDENAKAQILNETIKAIPTDGLGITKSDCDQFGVDNYAAVDEILQMWIGKHKGFEKLENNPVVKLHEATHYKRLWPITIPREKLLAGGAL